MSELKIDAGHNQYNPIRDFIDEAATVTAHEEVSVINRCTEIHKQAVSLLMRVSGTASHIGRADVTVTTPEVAYDTVAGNRGFIWLSSDFKKSDDSVAGFNSKRHRVRILMGTTTDRAQASPVLSVSKTDILYANGNYFKSGRHKELNFFQAVLEKITASAFSKEEPAKPSEYDATVQILARLCAVHVDEPQTFVTV